MFKVSLACTGESMTVRLNTEEPFLGRIFAQSKGKECEARGNARQEETNYLQILNIFFKHLFYLTHVEY
jgi:hypothetical protein